MVDLPTPPLPEAMQITFFTGARAPSGRPPGRPSASLQAALLLVAEHVETDAHLGHPSRAATLAATACWKWERIGQPGVVSETTTSTLPLLADVDRAHHPEIDDRPPQLGIDHGS